MEKEYIGIPDDIIEILFIINTEGDIQIRSECRESLATLMKGKYIRIDNIDKFIVGKKEYVITTLDKIVITYCKINGYYDKFETNGFIELLYFVATGFD